MALIGFGVLAAVIWFLTPSAPSYQGRPLTAWLDELCAPQSDNESSAQAEIRLATLTNVVRSVGSGALPFFVDCLDRKGSPEWYCDLDSWLRYKTSQHVGLPLSQDRRAAAVTCLRVLGPDAAPAVPRLTRLLNDEEDCLLGARALAAIGSQALPALSNAVATSSNDRIRWAAVEGIGDLGPAARPASNLLERVARESKPAVGVTLADLALRALVDSETNLDEMLPLLIRSAGNTNTALGSAYGLALLGSSGLPTLLSCVTNESAKIRLAAELALETDFPSALPRDARFNHFTARLSSRLLAAHFGGLSYEYQKTEPVLLRFTADDNPDIRVSASNALAALRLICTNQTGIETNDVFKSND